APPRRTRGDRWRPIDESGPDSNPGRRGRAMRQAKVERKSFECGPVSILGATGLALALGACGEDAVPPPLVRPVLSVVAKPKAERPSGYAGTVQPRYQTDRSFQVL